MSSTELVLWEKKSLAVASDPRAPVIIREALEQGARVWDLNRVRVPAGGTTVWSIAGLEGEENPKTIDAVVAFVRGKQRSWWVGRLDGGGTSGPPQCSSPDGIHGYGNPSLDQQVSADGLHECSTCRWSRFGSSRVGGRGSDCKQFTILLVFRQQSRMPSFLGVPAGSLKNLVAYQMKLAEAGKSIRGVATRFGLERVEGGPKGAYSRVTFAYLGDLDAEAAATVDGLSAVLDGSMPRGRAVEVSAEEVAGDAE